MGALNNILQNERAYSKSGQIKKMSKLDLISRLYISEKSNHDFNKIIDNNDFEKLINLETLNLSGLHYYNRQDSLFFEQLKKLKNLKIIEFNNVKINYNNLGELTNLTDLTIKNNQFLKEIPNISKLTNLKNIEISYTNIQEIPNYFINLNNLVILNLSGNKIEKIPELGLKNHLKYLILGNNKITKIEGLNNCINLEKLNLIHNNIFKIENLNNLENLIDLDLSLNPIKAIENLNKNIITNIRLHINSKLEYSEYKNINLITNRQENLEELYKNYINKIEKEKLTNFKKNNNIIIDNNRDNINFGF